MTTEVTQTLADSASSELADCGRKLLGLGLLSQTSGNISIKLPNDEVYITPTSMEYDRITNEDIVVVGLDGNVRQGSGVPSSETPLHCLVYETRPEVSAIVHTHSPYATTLAIMGMSIPAVHYMIAVLR